MNHIYWKFIIISLIFFVVHNSIYSQQLSKQINEVTLNHLYLYVDSITYHNIKSNDFLKNEFATFEHRSTTNKDFSYTGIYYYGTNTYFEFFNADADTDLYERDCGVALGTEKINGFTCTKKEVETTVELMGYKRIVKTIVWVSKRLDMPIRTKSQDGSITELRNIKEGAPANKYFEVPKEYKKVSNMLELMGMDISGSGTKRSKPANKGKESGSQLPFKLPAGIKLPSGNN